MFWFIPDQQPIDADQHPVADQRPLVAFWQDAVRVVQETPKMIRAFVKERILSISVVALCLNCYRAGWARSFLSFVLGSAVVVADECSQAFLWRFELYRAFCGHSVLGIFCAFCDFYSKNAKKQNANAGDTRTMFELTSNVPNDTYATDAPTTSELTRNLADRAHADHAHADNKTPTISELTTNWIHVLHLGYSLYLLYHYRQLLVEIVFNFSDLYSALFQPGFIETLRNPKAVEAFPALSDTGAVALLETAREYSNLLWAEDAKCLANTATTITEPTCIGRFSVYIYSFAKNAYPFRIGSLERPPQYSRNT